MEVFYHPFFFIYFPSSSYLNLYIGICMMNIILHKFTNFLMIGFLVFRVL